MILLLGFAFLAGLVTILSPCILPILPIVRHGQSEANLQDLYGMDTALTEKGREQIKELTGKLKDIKFDAIIASTMLRARQTAGIIALDHQLAVKTYEELKERNYGTFEGHK